MVAARFLCFAVGLLSFAFGGRLLAQTAEIEAELRLKLLELRLKEAQAKGQPKVAPKPKPLRDPVGALPEGAISRLGDSRLRHAGLPKCVAFSPDSKRMYSGGEDGMLRVWDVSTGEAVNSLYFSDGTLRQIRFTHDGTRLAVQFDNSQVRFLNPETLKEASEFSAEFGMNFAISDDGTLIAHYGQTGLLHVTELKTGLEKLELDPGSPFAFRPDGKTIAVASLSGRVTLYMLTGGKPVMSFAHGTTLNGKTFTTTPLNGLIFSPDGKRVATGGQDATGKENVQIWDITDAKNPKTIAQIKDVSRPHAWIGKDRLAVGGASSVGVYDFTEKKWVSQVKGIDGEWAISPDGTKVVSASGGGLRVRMWDLTTGKQLHAENDTFPDPALLAPSADGKSLFILSGDTAFDWPMSKATATAAGSLPGKAVHAAVGGGRLAVATPDAVLIYDAFDPAKPLAAKPSRTLTENANACRAIALSPDGKKVAYSANDNKTTIADSATGKTIRVLPSQTVGLALAFTPDGSKVAMIGRDGFLRLWSAEAAAGEEADLWKARVQRGQKGTIAVSPDGKLVAASSSGMVKIVDAATGSEVFTVGNLFEFGLFQQIAFSPDGRLLITASEGMSGGVQLWEVATQSLVRKFSTGFGTVSHIGVFPDGTRLASAGVEEAITIWDLTGRHEKDLPKADELLAAWGNLDSLDGAKGYPALRSLAAGGASSVRIVTAGMEEMLDTQKKIADLVKELGAEKPADREKATKELLKLGLRAMPSVQAASNSSESPEAKKRAEEILSQFAVKGLALPTSGLVGDTLRLFRAVQVLEDIGSPEAKITLDRIAKLGGPAADAAKAAIKRMGKKQD
jgi:WD40 repeat protein